MSAAGRARQPQPAAPGNDARPHGRSTGRTVAEWVSLGLSALLILGLAGFLLFEATRPSSPHVFPVIQPLPDNSRSDGSLHTLPVEVRNTGSKTLRDLRLVLSYKGAGGNTEESDLEIGYLGESSSTTVYFYLGEDPRGVKDLKVRPEHYRVE
jgi:uncharacterized protein (TIGR02588 family)